MTNERTSNLRQLSSWKEIAAYFGIGVRTAQMWERERGLPVHRLPGGRSHVSASVAELETWRGAAAPPDSTVVEGGTDKPIVAVSEGRAVSSDARATEPLPRWIWIAAAAAAVGILLAAAIPLLWPRNPVKAYVRDDALIAVDANGRETWRVDIADLDRHDIERSLWVGDLDGDTGNEVLFLARPHKPSGTRSLACYSGNGIRRWLYAPQHTVRTAKHRFEPPYSVANFLVLTIAGRRRVITSSTHSLYFPAQIALLDPADGGLLREYWHPGHLQRLCSLQKDGKTLLLAGGVNNARKEAAVVLLDPETMTGAASETDPAYQFQGFPPAREQARIFFPRSCINLKTDAFNAVLELTERPGYIVAEVQHELRNGEAASVFYHLNPDLSLRDMMIGTSFELAHRRLRAARVLDHDLSDCEGRALEHIDR